MSEFGLIDRIRARAIARDDVVLGIGDDAALLRVPAGMQLVVAMDTLNAGVHFPVDTAAADIGWKALAVNLSDLAAMGAQPAWCTLSLSLPQADTAWLDGFIEGFSALATRHDVALVGGDTTRGPLSVCVTVHGVVEPGRALRRDAARAGDEIWVSGCLGDAAGALALRFAVRDDGQIADVAGSTVPGGDALGALRPRLDRPTPRVALGRALAGLARACIDVSDGLVADLGHVCAASGVGAELVLDALPASDSLRAAFEPERLHALQAGGGDDYELCFTADAALHGRVRALAATTGVALSCIGRVVQRPGVRLLDPDGTPWSPPGRGYEHFR